MVAEESFFTEIILATAIERTGIVPGSIIAAFIFIGFHWRMYGWSSQILLALLVYRITSGIVCGLYRSVVPAATPHFIINVLAAAAN